MGRIILAETSEWYGRITMVESENRMAESPWPNPRIGWPNPNGMAESPWGKHPRMAESYALVAAVRNLAYHWHHLVLGASDASTHAWLG